MNFKLELNIETNNDEIKVNGQSLNDFNLRDEIDKVIGERLTYTCDKCGSDFVKRYLLVDESNNFMCPVCNITYQISNDECVGMKRISRLDLFMRKNRK